MRNELDIFTTAIELVGKDRDAYLEEVCKGKPELRARIDGLIAKDEQADQDDFLAPAMMNVKSTFAFTPRKDQLVGREIGLFKLERKIGQGGMGEVYLAHRTEGYKQEVAVKVLRQVVETDEMVRRFQSEAQFTAALGKHPNIASLIDAGTTDDGLLYLVMDYVDGQRIDQYCDAKRLTNEQRLDLFLQVCDAVQYAHQNAVIHRDLKPSNILVSNEGEVKLIDFGIAKLTNPQLGFQDESTRTIFRVLTPEYASPEQARGELPTTASDVYSLGVVLYGLLTGRSPYEVATTDPQKLAHTIENVSPLHPSQAIDQSTTTFDDSTLEQVAQNRNVTPQRLKRQLTGDLSTIVLMAMRKESERRYGTAKQFGDDIRKYLTGHPVEARKDTIRYRTGKFVRRNRFAVAAATLVLATLLAGIVGTSTQWLRAERESKRAELNATEALAEADRANALARRETESRITAEVAERKAASATRQAELKAETAQQVSDFMVRLFQGADRFGVLDYQFGPTPHEVANPTANQLLARGRERLDAELKDQPVVRAALKARVAQVYLSLGLYSDAETLLESALKTQRTHVEEVATTDLIETLSTLGVIRYLYGYYDESREHLGEAIKLSDESYGDTDPRGANTKLLYAMVEMEAASKSTGDWLAARDMFWKVVSIRENETNAAPFDMAHAYIGESIAYRTIGDNGKSLVSLGKAGKILLFTPGGSDYLKVWMLALQATLSWQGKKTELACQQTDELMKLLRELLGEKHPAVAHIQIDFAGRIYRAGEQEKAEAYLRQGIAAAREVFGRQPRTAFALCTLGGQLLKQKKKLEEAEALLRESVEIYSETIGGTHVQTLKAKEQHSMASKLLSLAEVSQDPAR